MEAHAPCEHCIAKSACLARANRQDGFAGISRRVFKAKDFLFYAGDEFEGIYTLRSGAAKSVMLMESGHEQIIQFHFPGALLGADGFETHQHVNHVQFLQTSSVCFFPVKDLKRFVCDENDISSAPLLQAMSHEINTDHRNELTLSQLTSSQRFAQFLLEQSEHMATRGMRATEFDLVMSKTDIANYLGIAIETLSRLFNKFQSESAISVFKRHIKILDKQALQNYQMQLSD